MASKKAFVKDNFKSEKINGIEPNKAINIQLMVVKRKACLIDKLNSLFLFAKINIIPTNRLIKEVKMKISHSLVSGTPVVTTEVGAEGIDINDTKGMWVTNDISKMIKLINKLLPQYDLLTKRGQLGRNAVIELFSEAKIISKFELLYTDLLKK